MKYLISESRLNELMIKVFDREIDPQSIKSYYPIETDEFGYEYEIEDMVVFYKHDDVDEGDVVFRYYYCEYFYEGVTSECPRLSLETFYIEKFNSLFGDLWMDTFRNWVNETFDLNAKLIE